MADNVNWHERWLARLPSDRILTRLLLDSFQEHRWKYLAASGAMMLVAVSTAASAWMMGQIVDALSAPENRSQVFAVAAGVATVFMFRGIANYIQAVLLARAGNSIVAEKQMQIYHRILSQGLAFYSRNQSSNLLLRVTRSAQAARRVIDTIISGFVRDLLTLVGLLFLMFYQQPLLSLVSLVVAPVVVLGIQRILKLVRDATKQEMAGFGEIIQAVQETALGVRVVKAFGLEKQMANRMQAAIDHVEDRNNRLTKLQSATMPLLDTVAGLAIASIVILSTIDSFGQTPGTAGQLMSFVTAFLMSYEPASRLSKMRVTIERNLNGVRMMYELLDAPQTMIEEADALPLKEGPGSVTFENVSFAYKDHETILKSVNVSFRPGKITALVGPSGGGKSTLLNLILRLYDPTEGTVLINGQDIRTATLVSVRQKIALVSQDTFLFSGSIMDNLLVARTTATIDEAIAAAKAAHAHDFIEKLSEGYNTSIGENGSFLSGGQRQRISIARAILRNAPILLLDEATSALDSHSEILVRDAIEKLAKGVTTIVIAHRLSTVTNADEICYIEAGQIVEQGTISELLALNGKFKSLYDVQFKGKSDTT